MIYLDNCSSTQVSEEVASMVKETMLANFANPSASYFIGANAYKAIGIARSQVAKIIACEPSKIVFTSGGTESNNLAILGCAKKHPEKRHIITTAIEHDSVLNACRFLESTGYEVNYIMPNKEGNIEAEEIVNAIRDDTLLVSCMSVNNETGAILPISKICEKVKERNPEVIIHSDCVQGYGKIPFKIYENKLDLLSASAHKIHGPKGIGLLYQRTNNLIAPLFYGGKQENGIHPGTENVQSICGFGMAADQAAYKLIDRMEAAMKLKTYLIELLSNELKDICINSPPNSSPYILNFSLPISNSVDIIRYLSLNEIYVSSASSCTKGKESHVLKAMGLAKNIINSSIRVGLSKYTTSKDIEILVDTLRLYQNQL